MPEDAARKLTFDNPYFVLLARVMMVIATTVILPIALFLGSRFVNSVDKITDKVNEINVTVQETNVSVRGVQGQLSEVKTQLNDHEGRIRFLERPSIRLIPPG